MKFTKLTQRRARIASAVAGTVWIALFVGMVVASKATHHEPTARWLGLYGPLLFIVGADNIVNSELHANNWTAVERNPDFYVHLGVVALVLASVLTVVGIGHWSVAWFE